MKMKFLIRARLRFTAARPAAKPRQGFTLIELLVVVLIIGILAAIAVPQYQKAVNKSRVAQAYIYLKALAGAQERYFLETGGTYATRFDQLDVFMDKSCTAAECTVGNYKYQLWGGIQKAISVVYLNTGLSISYFYEDPDTTSVYYTYGARKGYYKCSPTNSQETKLCLSLSTGAKFKYGTSYFWKP